MIDLERRTGLITIAPLCELKGCENRADYFWLAFPIDRRRLGWLPICHDCAIRYTDSLLMELVPVAETSAEPRRHPPLPMPRPGMESATQSQEER